MTTPAAPAHQIFFLRHETDATWYRFEEVASDKMEIECYWQYDLRRRLMLTKEAARQMWKDLTTKGYARR